MTDNFNPIHIPQDMANRVAEAFTAAAVIGAGVLTLVLSFSIV
ncbi:MAG TPA: hypothetical protein VIJ72_06190 [Rhizomicrobium sp.]